MQRYQPPHERRKVHAQPTPGESTGQGEGSTSQRLGSSSTLRGTENDGTTANPNYRKQLNNGVDSRRNYGNQQPYPPRYNNQIHSDPSRNNALPNPPISTSLPNRINHSHNNAQYTPRTSKKDWSTPSKGVLASPAADIKPMRHRGNGINGKPDFKEDEYDFELIQSVSRSGGDGAEGDALKDWDVQDRYRLFIDKKIEKHNRTFNTKSHKPPLKDSKDEIESLGSIVLLFRKLREGVVASSRIDKFAVEVFESSAQFSILANNKPQLISSLSGLVLGLYRTLDDRGDKGKAKATSQTLESDSLDKAVEKLSINDDRRIEFVSLFLLYQLVILGEQEFWSSYFELTSPRRKILRRPFDEDGSYINTTSQRITAEIQPFISPSEIGSPISIARSISPNQFDPIKYFKLYESATTYEKVILSWGEDKIRERAWEVLRKAYTSTSLDWAGKFVGKEDYEAIKWIGARGGKIEGGVIRLR